jgi:hypothetical protein
VWNAWRAAGCHNKAKMPRRSGMQLFAVGGHTENLLNAALEKPNKSKG